MNQAAEEVSTPLEPVRRSRKAAEGGILGAIRSMGAWTRVAVASLGLLGAAESGCAHVPKPVPSSQAQSERQICVMWTGDGSIQPHIAHILNAYFSQNYTNVVVNDLGFQNIKDISLYQGVPGQKIVKMAPWRESAFVRVVHGPPPFEKYIRENLPSFAQKNCDDVVGIELRTALDKRRMHSSEPGFYDELFLNIRTSVFNLDENRIVVDVIGNGSKLKDRCTAWDTDIQCGEKPEIPLESFLGDLDVDDLLEDRLFNNYHPDQLPPLSLAHIEQILHEEIEKLYAKYEKTKEPLPEEDFARLKKLGDEYLTRFQTEQNTVRVSAVMTDITERIASKQRKERLAKDLRDGKGEGAKAVQELRMEISLGQQAERRGDYREAEKHFSNAQQIGYRVDSAYQAAGIRIPSEVHNLGDEIARGLHENQERLGIAQIGRPRDQDDFGFAWGMLRDNFIAELPGMGIVTTKVVQIENELREKLAQEGLTGELEVTFVHHGPFPSTAFDDMEVTVKRKSPSYFSSTFKTSKESILAGGGRVTFQLAPGTYELNCPKCKEPYTVEVKPGQTALTIELQ